MTIFLQNPSKIIEVVALSIFEEEKNNELTDTHSKKQINRKNINSKCVCQWTEDSDQILCKSIENFGSDSNFNICKEKTDKQTHIQKNK